MKDLSENDSPIKVTCGNYYDRARPGVLYEQRRFFLNEIKADFSKEGLKQVYKKKKLNVSLENTGLKIVK